jgi:hypothetical protein
VGAYQRWLERRRDGGLLNGVVIPAYVCVAALAVGIAIVCALCKGLAPGASGGCSLHVGAALAGDADVFADHIAPGCSGLSVDEARKTVIWDFALVALYAPLGTAALLALWPRAWRIRRMDKLRVIAFAFTGAGVFDVVENVSVLVGLEEGPALAGLPARAAGVAGWWKWMLFVAGSAALTAAVCAAIGNRRVPQPPERTPRPREWGPVRDEIGICLSGGGIRSASFALGALRALDRRGLLRRARWIAAVSGGAYAAGAWSIARGSAAEAGSVRPQPGDVDGLLEPPGEPDFFAYIRKNRRYLSTGRGGTPATFLTGAVFGAFNVFVLAALVCLVAWPVGYLASTWAIQPGLRDFTYTATEVQSLTVPPRLWLPGLGGFAAGALLFVVSLAFWDPARERVFAAAAFFAGGGALLLGLLVGVPVAMTEMPKAWDALSGHPLAASRWASVVAAIALGAAVLWFVVRPVAAKAARLGGVLLAVVALLLAGRVATDAAYGVRWFAWSLREYAVAASVFAVFYLLADPQTWSLFRLYWLRLRSTFATTQNAAKRARHAPAFKSVYPLSVAGEPAWSEYSGRPGPKLLVCAAAQRNDTRVTGVPAESFTFSDDAVALRSVAFDADDKHVLVDDAVAPVEQYVRLVQAPHLGTVSATVAMSGAAFTSAMGRQSLGTTNAALAAFNVRLGMWMPNPRYAAVTSRRLRRPRVGYLLKELFGVYDPDDPYVYVTDGGHWENLGLVELVRRRARWIFCVDASGDRADSFATLEEAIVMARMECGVEIVIDPTPLRRVDGRLPKTAVVTGVIRYPKRDGADGDDHTGRLFYGKALLAQDSPMNTLSFSLRDRIYPRYPTYDQFLSEDEFMNLVRLGEWVGRGLALEHERFGPPP